MMAWDPAGFLIVFVFLERFYQRLQECVWNSSLTNDKDIVFTYISYVRAHRHTERDPQAVAPPAD